jgi:hypothetical protein
VIGGSNLSFGQYPEENCQKPTKPIRPFGSSSWEVNSYNSQVDAYNSGLDRYIQGVREYLDNAKLDIQRVQERMREAVDRARSD